MKPYCARCHNDDEAPEILMWGCTRWCRSCALTDGGTIGRRKVALRDARRAGFTSATLQALANGAIMDPNALFLPDGKLSMEETRRREGAGVERLP
jgi:hypothetical protein